MTDMAVSEALAILKQYRVTDSIQYVRRLIREGKIPARAPSKRKEGYRILEEDLMAYIYSVRPEIKMYLERIAELEQKVGELQRENDELRSQLTSTQTASSPPKPASLDENSTRADLIEKYRQEHWKLEILDDEKEELSPLLIDNLIKKHHNDRQFEFGRQMSTFITNEGLRVRVLDNMYKAPPGGHCIQVTLLPDRELTRAQVDKIWTSESKKISKDDQHLVEQARTEFMRHYLPNDATHTTFYKEKYERFECPMTGSRFKKPENLVAKCVHLWIDSIKRENERKVKKQERDQENYDMEIRRHRNQVTKSLEETYVDLIDERDARHGYLDDIKSVQLKAVNDLLIERGIDPTTMDLDAMRYDRAYKNYRVVYARTETDELNNSYQIALRGRDKSRPEDRARLQAMADVLQSRK